MIVKIDINEKEIKSKNPEGSKAFKTQMPDAWLATWQNSFNFDVIWTAFQLFLKLHSHISVFWRFCRISVISEFSFLGVGLTENLYFQLYEVPMYVDLCFDHYFNCLSIKTDISKNRLNFICPEGSKAFKTQITAAWWAMWLNHFGIISFESISRVFEVTYSHFSFLGFLMNFRDFWVFVFGYRPQNENPEITENLYFWVCKVEMDVDPFLYLYFNFLSVKTEIKKNYNKRLNFINLKGSKALKRQIAAT